MALLVMIDIISYADINITGFDLHIFDTNEVTIRILSKDGSFVG
jgi:hypothetical protein